MEFIDGGVKTIKKATQGPSTTMAKLEALKLWLTELLKMWKL
jgi:hypothetical protein